MKKTISVHIGGRVFNIEEDAYDKLNRYLLAIRQYFNDQDSADEIIADIELRLAELFMDRLAPHREVVTSTDVNEVIEIMGRPEAFADSEDEGSDDSRQAHKRGQNPKRVFRDPDNKVIFGVCGGISAYFGWDPIILRILFVVLFIAYGWGLLIYLILAIIIPKAKTTAEKLQMRGEPVTVENISKKVSKSFEDVKEDLKDFGKKNDINEERIKSVGQKIGDFFTQLGEGILKVLVTLIAIFGRLIGVVILFASFVVIMVIVSMLFGWDMAFKISDGDVFLDDHVHQWVNALIADPTQRRLFFWSAAGTLIIPLLGFLMLGLRLLFDIRRYPSYLGWILTALWLVSAVALTYVGVSLYKEFHVKASYTEPPIHLPATGETLVIDAEDSGDPKYAFRTGFGKGRAFFQGTVTFPGIDSTQLLYIERNRLTIAMNEENDQFQLEIRRSARGSSQKAAIKHAEAIHLHHDFDQDSLRIYPFFVLDKGQKIRGQRATYILHVPVGKRVHLSPKSRDILHDIPNITNTLDRDMVGHTWVMTRNGLACETCIGERQDAKKGRKKVPIEIELTE